MLTFVIRVALIPILSLVLTIVLIVVLVALVIAVGLLGVIRLNHSMVHVLLLSALVRFKLHGLVTLVGLRGQVQRSLLVNNLELLDHVDGDRAEVAAHKGHAALLVSRDEQRAAAAEAVTVVLARHSVAPVHRAEHVAGKFGRLCWHESSLRRRLVFLPCHFLYDAESLQIHVLVGLGLEHLEDGVEGTRAVVAYEHRDAPVVAFGEDLGAAAAPAVAIMHANLVIAEVFVALLLAGA